jgi:SpoVK/Ycf46/Vps4 family AAA+-type ATPase
VQQARMEILKIHAANITKHGDIDYEAVVKLAENFNGADLRNVCTEAGMFAIRDERDYIVQVSCGVRSTSQQGAVWRSLLVRALVLSSMLRLLGDKCVRQETQYVISGVQEDMMKAVRKLNEAKKLEGNLSYDQSFGEGKG